MFSLYIHCNPAFFHLVIAAVQGAEQVFNQNYLIGHFLKTNFSRLALALADEGQNIESSWGNMHFFKRPVGFDITDRYRKIYIII